MSFSRVDLMSSLLMTCAAVGLGSCNAATSTVQVRTDGRVRVLPQEFTQDAGCSFSSGDENELSHYVVSLVDLGLAPEDTSEPVSSKGYPKLAGEGTVARCSSSLTYSTSGNKSIIDLDHRYVALVDGYSGAAPRVRGERAPGAWPLPRWQWVCGVGGLDADQVDWLARAATRLPLDTSVPALGDGGASTSAGGTRDGDSGTLPWSDAGVASSDSGSPFVLDASPPNGDAGTTLALDTSTPPAVTDASTPVSSSDGGDAADSATSAAPDGAVTTSDEESESSSNGDDDVAARLRAASRTEGFPGPAEVRKSGQSGIRGCVPLF